MHCLRPLLIIDVAHLNGQYKGTNLVAVGMDGNNQIVPIAFGICKGETCPCWSWWMSILKECIPDSPNLLFIFDCHAAIALAVQNEFPLAFHVSDAYHKLIGVDPHRWLRAHCPLVCYNYMTSNSVESVNACIVLYRKLSVLKLAETYHVMVQEWFTSPPERKFVDGLVATVDPIELDSISTNQVKLILTNSLGYDFNSKTFLYLRNPNCSLDSGLIPLASAIQDRDMLLTYAQTHQNRLHVYVSWVEISSLVVADQRKD
ncbi:transposase, MuDR, MULE transposase domain protein [Tanacetum coccineum]